MINPHTSYIIGFAASLIVYQLGWSEVYPQLQLPLLCFLMISINAHLILSARWSTQIAAKKIRFTQLYDTKLNPWAVTAFLYLLWTLDFIYEGGVPLIKILLSIPFDYKLFGMPVLHVFAVSFSSFYCIYLLQFFLITRNKSFLLLYLINMGSSVLICSRFMLAVNLISSFFLYLLCFDKVPFKIFLFIVPMIILLGYAFGVMGNIRVSFESKKSYDQSLFLETGKATAQFRNSAIPKEFFWPYIYISSPIANLQTNIKTFHVPAINTKRVIEYVNNEWLFESLSKRVNGVMSVEREKENVIKDPFNVSTVYSRSFSYLSWFGIIIMGLLLLIIPILYLKAMHNNPYQIIAVSILCTTYLFLSYDNSIRLMGLGFQLVYPLLFPAIEKKISLIKVPL